MRSIVSVLIALVVAFPHPLLAESPEPVPTRPSASAPLPGYLQTLELKADIAERNYLVEKSAENFAHFVNTQQRIIAAVCFGSLRETLQYDGYPADERCRDHIKKVLAVDGNSPVANCAQFGIDSRQCREAYDSVRVGSYAPESGSWVSSDRKKSGTMHLIDLAASLKEKSLARKRSDIDNSLNELAASGRVNPGDLSYKTKFEAILQDALKMTCGDEELALDPIKGENSAEEPVGVLSGHNAATERDDEPSSSVSSTKSTLDPETDAFAGVLNSLEKIRPTAAPTAAAYKFDGPNFVHHRLNPNGCNRYILKGMDFIPTSPVVICYRDGGVSPSCIDARRRHSSTDKSGKRRDESFVSF